ncbi:TetR family transcriptional regulator [Alteribacter lacisalsi]|uniref:TetR family transcriptional regulator n=1 Tax=Alteribacter lacisalsi TaxID=2045244 RepID=A0A2W0HL33_9BACI|nr:TetR family transcriptional regulator [Alteribacter lacisalsi]PYZ97802.1 TetR family transcriptional regulator [Alteribacter lacisalsi]
MERKDGKYNQILDAAMKVLSEGGFEKTPVSRIVKEAGVAQGTFYLYFSSKSEVVPAIAERIFNEQMAAISESDRNSATFADTLKVMIVETFRITRRYRNVIIFCYSGMAFYQSFDRWEKIYRPYYNWVQERLDAALERGECSPVIDSESQVKMMISTIENTAENYFFSHSDSSDKTVEDLKKNVFAFLNKTI